MTVRGLRLGTPLFVAREPCTPNAGSLIQEFSRILRQSGKTYPGFERESGIARRTIYNWLEAKDSPRLDMFRAALNTLDYDLAIVRKRK